MIPEIGLKGQEELKKAKVLVVGAGGLGCPVLQSLAAAGIGKIGLADYNIIDESDLPNQVLYGSLDIGKLKVIIAKSWLERLNSLIEIEISNLRLDVTNALNLIKKYDLVVDATNDSKVTYIINDSCIILNKPMVYGSILKFEGEVSVFNLNGGPTYRCYKTAGKSASYNNPGAADIGQMGVLSGVTGNLMANEVIKIITGAGKVLGGNLLIFNISEYSFNITDIKNIPENHIISDLKAD